MTLAHSGMSPESDGWLRDTLDEVICRLRELIEVSGVAFEVVDTARGEIRPATSWFATEDASRAFSPVLRRPYDPEHPGVTEAAIERGSALLLEDIPSWDGASGLRARLDAGGNGDHAWEWYRAASFISCPVATAGGSTLGVLVISSHPPLRPLGVDDLRAVEVFARMAALALERSERTREEQLLNRALQAVSASLEPSAVYRAVIEQAMALTGATKSLLWRYDPTVEELRMADEIGFTDRIASTGVRLGEGMLGRAAETGVPYLSREEDRSQYIRRIVDPEGIGSFVHVPVTLGGRLFGVLSATHEAFGHFGDDELRVLQALGLGAAGAIANALDYQRERRVAGALTRGFVPEPPAALIGFDVGLVYVPTGQDLGGGDLFGVWRGQGGGLVVLLGDVTGKGLEVAAMSAMVRFFVEARAFDADNTADVLAQTNRILRGRLPSAGFATAFLAVIEDGRVRYCNAGHPPPLVLRADGGEDELAGGGLPLGVDPDADYVEHERSFAPGDTLFGATDGLLEARRDGRFFADARLPELLAAHGRALAPQALAEFVQEEAERWESRRHDDVAVLVVRTPLQADLRREPAHGPAARALFDEYIGFVRERIGPGFEPHERIFATEGAFEEHGAAFLVLYEDDQPVACGGVRLLAPDIAEVKRMFVTAGQRRRGRGRRMLAELETLAAAAGARRVRLLTTDALVEARALYADSGYREVEEIEREGRRDSWLEKRL